jgi:hypothetical protein
MTITTASYATPSTIAKAIAQGFWVQSVLIKTASQRYRGQFSENAITTPGTTTYVPLDNRFTVQRSNTVTLEAIVDRVVPLTVQNPYRTAVQMVTTDQKLLIRNLKEQTAVPMGRVIAAAVEQDLISQFELYCFNSFDLTKTYNGSASGYLDTNAKMLQAATFFREYSVPEDGKWYAAMNPTNLAQLFNGYQSEFLPITNEKALAMDIRARGEIQSFKTFYSQVLYTHVGGTAGGDSNAAVNATVSSGSTVVLKNLSVGATLLPGDRLIFTSSYPVNPVTRNDITSKNFTAVVAAAATADGSGIATVQIYVGPQGINATTTDPYRNLNRPLTANDGVQIITNFAMQLFYHQDGVLYAPIPQIAFDLAASQVGTATDPNSGVQMRMTNMGIPGTNVNSFYLDALIAMGIVPELCILMMTTA